MDTQARIIEHLDLHGNSTVYQLSCALGLTKADIRYHLKTLIKNNQVTQSSEPLKNGLGRPAAQYYLDDLPPVKLYSSVLDSILKFIYTSDFLIAGDQQLADSVVFCLLTGIEDSGSPAVKLSRRIEHLTTLGFRIRWEAGPQGPVIQIQKEPITTIIKNPELSKLILSNLVKQINKKSLA